MRIAISITSQQKGFLISVAQRLARCHNVFILARDANVAALVARVAPELVGKMLLQPDMTQTVPVTRAMQEALELEQTYAVRMSFMMGKDRALGRGYIFNADRYPDVGSSWWGHERKLAEMVGRFRFAERFLDMVFPDVIVGLQKMTELYCVAAHRGVRYFSPAPIKFASRFLVSDNEHMTSDVYRATISALAAGESGSAVHVYPYEQEAGSKYNHSRASYTWCRVLKDVARQGVEEIKRIVRSTRPRDGYRLFGWVPSRVRRKLAYTYFVRHGRTPADLKGYRLVYLPLHLEPEIALLGVSPEFNNSMEIVAWVSKSLPADSLLVVKEQPFSFGVRSRQYYDMFRRIGNVVLARPDITSWAWIEASALVVTITGTAGTEAVNFLRPVLSYGAHQAINLLPSVRFADSYASTRRGVDELLELGPEHPDLVRSRWCLNTAQIDSSFELPGFERTYASSELQPELAARFIQAMEGVYPELAAADAGASAA